MYERKKKETIKSYKRSKARETKENVKGDAGSKRDPEVSEGGQSPHLKGAFPTIGERDCTKTVRGPKAAEFHSFGTARGR